MKFSVVIATRDRVGFLATALESLATQIDAPSYEVVVVDNGSRDATEALVRERAATRAFPLHYVYAAEPNRGAARNAGIVRASGDVVAFVDDDVVLSERFLFAHATAHAHSRGRAVSGPIVNVPDTTVRVLPNLANYSGAFFCTCNVSVERSALVDVGGFDERFDLYGWEDTELGLRLRGHGVRRAFAWDAFLWHIKPEKIETLDVVAQKTRERAAMAGRLLRKNASLRTKLATGAYGLNLARSAILAPAWSLAGFRALATNEAMPAVVRAIARGQYLDGAYTHALRAAIASDAADRDAR